jgi:hypothetical protein
MNDCIEHMAPRQIITEGRFALTDEHNRKMHDYF